MVISEGLVVFLFELCEPCDRFVGFHPNWRRPGTGSYFDFICGNALCSFYHGQLKRKRNLWYFRLFSFRVGNPRVKFSPIFIILFDDISSVADVDRMWYLQSNLIIFRRIVDSKISTNITFKKKSWCDKEKLDKVASFHGVSAYVYGYSEKSQPAIGTLIMLYSSPSGPK